MTPFGSLAHARAALEISREDFNTERPYLKIDWQKPAGYAATFPCRDLTLRYADGSAPDHDAYLTDITQPHRWSELSTR